MEGRFSRFFERILVFSTIVSLMLTATSIFSTVLNNFEVERILIDWFTYVVIIGSGIVFTLVLQIFAIERIKPAMHIVFIFFYIIIILILCYMTGKLDAPYVLIVILIIQYFLQVGINELFVFHDKFMLDCEVYEGKELEQYLFHNNLSAIDLTEKIKGQQAIMFAISIAMFMVLVFGKLSKGYFTLITIGLVIIFYLSVLLCCFMLGIFKNDIFYAFLGFKNYVSNGKKIFGAVLMIALISGLSAYFISSDNPIIKISYLDEYKETHTSTPNSIPEIDFLNYPELQPVTEDYMGNGGKPIWILEVLMQVIKYVAILGIIVGLLYFFIRPFFSRNFRLFWTEGHLFKFFMELWEEILEFIRYVFSKSDKTKEAYSTVQSKKFQETMMDFLKKVKRSKAKVEEIDRLTKQFMRIIDWGQIHGIKYLVNLAPAEYTALIEEKYKDNIANGLVESSHKAGQLFEKALYDKEVLTSEEENTFTSAVKLIINTNI